MYDHCRAFLLQIRREDDFAGSFFFVQSSFARQEQGFIGLAVWRCTFRGSEPATAIQQIASQRRSEAVGVRSARAAPRRTDRIRFVREAGQLCPTGCESEGVRASVRSNGKPVGQ